MIVATLRTAPVSFTESLSLVKRRLQSGECLSLMLRSEKGKPLIFANYSLEEESKANAECTGYLTRHAWFAETYLGRFTLTLTYAPQIPGQETIMENVWKCQTTDQKGVEIFADTWYKTGTKPQAIFDEQKQYIDRVLNFKKIED